MNPGVKRLDPTCHDLGRLGVVLNGGNRDALGLQRLLGATRAQQYDPLLRQLTREIQEPTFVRNREKCALDHAARLALPWAQNQRNRAAGLALGGTTNFENLARCFDLW